MLVAVPRQRPGRVYLWLILGLLTIFVSLLVYRLWFRGRFIADADLVRELEGATIVEGPASPAGPADWPQWRGLHRDGVSPETGWLKDWPDNGPPVLWRQPTGEGFSSIAVANGRAFTLVRIDNREEVICWDAAGGKELWRFPYPCDWNSDYPGTRATPTVDGDLVYTLGATGMLHCLDAATGKKIWERDLLALFQAKNPRWGMAGSPLVEGGRLFINPGGPDGNSLAALDKKTGYVLWHQHDFPAGYSSPIGIGPPDQRQIVFFTGNHLVGVTPADGKLLWQYNWETSYGVNAATPLWIQAKAGDRALDYLFISSGYGKGCALLKLEPQADGSFEVRRVYEGDHLCCHFSSPVRSGDYLYGFGDPGELTCMNVRNGKVMWTEKKFAKGSLLLADGQLIVLGENGKLAVVEATPEEYREQALYPIFRNRSNGRFWSMPVLSHGRLYVRNQDEVLCLDLSK